MARTDKVTKIVALLLFLAIAAYLGAYFIRAAENDIQTSVAVETTLRNSVSVSGLVVRSESVLESAQTYISILAEEGSRVSAGGSVAMAYSSEEALERADRIRYLQNEIARLQTVFDETISSSDIIAKNSAVSSAVTNLTTAVARHELADLDTLLLGVSSSVFTNADLAQETEIGALTEELNELYNNASTDTMTLRAEKSGLFSTIVDGYEGITPSALASYSPSRLSELMESGGEKSENAIGKLVYGMAWYFAAICDSEALPDLAPGDRVTLQFARYTNAEIRAEVSSISREEDGKIVVVFSCTSAMADTLAMRLASAEVVLSTTTGIRIPKNALHSDADGDFVYTLTGMRAERKDVEILAETEDYYLAAEGTEADSLRAGNEILSGSKELFDGMVIE